MCESVKLCCYIQLKVIDAAIIKICDFFWQEVVKDGYFGSTNYES
jgi:hypothetical protein